MAYNQFTCETPDAITGWSEACESNISAPAKLFLQKEDDAFNTEVDAKDLTKWQEKIVSKDILPLPLVQEFDDNSDDDVYYTSPITSIDKFVREGKTKFKFRLLYDACLYKRMRQLNGTVQRLIISDNDQNVIGTSPDGVKFQGVVSGTFRVEKWVQSDGSNPSFIPVHFAVESGVERNDNVAVFKVDWNIKMLNGVQPAKLEVQGTPSATEIIVNVAGACDGVAIEGLLVADFLLLDGSGVAQTITTATESTTIPGQYVLAGTALETGTLNLNDVVTVGTYYYQGTAVDVTI